VVDDPTEVTKREGHASERAERKPDHLERGTLVGRYVILDVIGEGGMGVVYAAFDPELDRKVALKLMQARPTAGSTGGEQAYLLREAQALARLAHPNVIAVHDVGSLSRDRVFIAMELVDGETLRAWLGAKRTWREALAALLGAGAGLAAAHAAGLVHRDFKPENVLVGKDGRVRVMDFGLARLDPEQDDNVTARTSDLHIEAKSPLSESLTGFGKVVGTPAYMAPEIYEGHPADARSDQFAFGVALYEALYRTRPYDKLELQRREAKKPKAPPASSVPARVQRAVLRAVSVDARQRFRSMDELLAALTIDHGARRRNAVLGGAVALAALAAGGGALAWSRHDAAQVCTGAEHQLAGVWDANKRATVKGAFLATNEPFAAQSFDGVAHALDRYASDWTGAWVETCEATKKRGEQTEVVMQLRQACLGQRLEGLRALTHLLETAEGNLVEQGDKAVWSLDAIAPCSNVTRLLAPGLPPPDKLLDIKRVEAQLATARADVIAGRMLPALTATRHAVEQGKQLAYDPILSEALFLQGSALLGVGNREDGVASIGDAVWAAVRGRRDDIVALASFAAAMATSDMAGDPARARVWLGLGIAASSRVGIDHAMEYRRYLTEGMVAAQAGDHVAAVAAHEKAVAIAEQAQGHDNPALWADEQMLATTLSRASSYGRAAQHYERALALREQTVGRDHAEIALILSNLGAAYQHVGDRKKARAAFERALDIRERAYGKNSPMLVPTLDNFAELLQKERDFDGALAMLERAKELAALLPGIDHPVYHTVITDLAEVLVDAHRFAEARKLYDELIPAEIRTQSTELPQTLASRAELAIAEKAWPDAATFASRSIDAYEAAGGKDNPDLWRPLTALAGARIGAGKSADARPLLERAIAIGDKGQLGNELAPARAALAALGSP
jgi:tetratricopeptide (TPR) repeat protein